MDLDAHLHPSRGGAARRPRRLPDFLIIGAQKAGTTWLHHNLRQHPQVFMPRREVHFFDKADRYARGLEWYTRFFDAAGDATTVGEKTPDYLWTGGAPTENHLADVHRNIHRHLPKARLVVVLRDPVKRAISAAIHVMRTGRVAPRHSIDDLVRNPELEVVRRHGVLEKGLYFRQIAAYRELFPAIQLKVLIFEEDVAIDPEVGLRDVCQFLDVDPTFPFAQAGRKRNRDRSTYATQWLRYYFHLPRQIANHIGWLFPERRTSVSRDTLDELAAYYREENERLFELLGRRVGSWIRPL